MTPEQIQEYINKVVSERKQNARAAKGTYMKGYSRANAEAIKVYNRNYYKENRKAFLSYQLKYEYGITDKERDALIEAQGGKCKLCGKPGHNGKREAKLYVDHCHETGAIRGMLCHKCNGGLGALGDNEEGLLKALAYVRGESA